MNLAEFGGESGLLDATVDGQRNDEHLLPVSQMSKRRQQTVTDLPANNDTSHSSLRNANPRGIFQTRVPGLQTRVPGLDYVSPAGTVQLVVNCQRQTRESWTVASPRGGLGSTPLLLEVASEIDTNPTSFYMGGGIGGRTITDPRARHVCPPHIF